jgi:hypothetical protein
MSGKIKEEDTASNFDGLHHTHARARALQPSILGGLILYQSILIYWHSRAS